MESINEMEGKSGQQSHQEKTVVGLRRRLEDLEKMEGELVY